MYSHLDYNHWLKVRAARIEQGLPVRKETIAIDDHPLCDKSIKDINTGEMYTVAKVYKDWHYDWFTVVMFERNGSHGGILLDAGVHCRGIYEDAVWFHERFVVV